MYLFSLFFVATLKVGLSPDRALGTFNVWDWQTLAKMSFYLCKVFETGPIFANSHLKVFKNVHYFFLLNIGIRIWCWFFRSIFEKSLQRIWNLHQILFFEENFLYSYFLQTSNASAQKKRFAKSRNSYFGNDLSISVWFFLKFQNLSLKLKLPTARIRERFEPKAVDEDDLVADAGLEGEGHDRQDRQGPAEDQQPHRRRTEEALIRRIRTCKNTRIL